MFYEIFKFYLKLGIRKTRTKLFLILSSIPILLFLLLKILLVNANSSQSNVLIEIILFFYISFLTPILAIFFGTSIIKEEIEDKTLTYITSRPISKTSFFLGKFFSYCLIIFVIIIAGFLPSLIIIKFNQYSFQFLFDFFHYLRIIILSILAYSSAFAFLSIIINKATIVSLIYIFGWEALIQFMPGSMQKLTIVHYIKSQLPSLQQNSNFLLVNLESTSITSSIITLLAFIVIFLFFGVIIFKNKKYIL